MTSSPKRPWFRFHLLTAVLMMLAAALSMFLNLNVARERPIAAASPNRISPEELQNIYVEYWGFPVRMGVRIVYIGQNPQIVADGDKIESSIGDPDGIPVPILYRPVLRHMAISRAILNLVFGIIAVAGVAFVSEWLIRRREGQKP